LLSALLLVAILVVDSERKLMQANRVQHLGRAVVAITTLATFAARRSHVCCTEPPISLPSSRALDDSADSIAGTEQFRAAEPFLQPILF
jgi:hypothetical protein